MPRVQPDQRCTPQEQWPEKDRIAWNVALKAADPLDPATGYAHRWKPSTVKAVISGYGRWLGWLERTGQLDPGSSPGERATRECVKAYRTALEEAGLADNSIAGRLSQLAQALNALSPGDWAWLARAARRLYSNAVLVRDPITRLRPLADVLRLAEDLMEAAEHSRFRDELDRAKLYRDGLLIAFLLHRPLRLSNLTSLMLDRHLDGRGEGWRLRIHQAETKTGEPLYCDWPDCLVSQLETYLVRYRPTLLRAAASSKRATDALWISKLGAKMGTDSVAKAIGHRTLGEFGVSINPHSFRHIAATALAEANPEGNGGIMNVLGHSSMKTSESHYNKARISAAQAHYQMTLAKLRRPARRVKQ